MMKNLFPLATLSAALFAAGAASAAQPGWYVGGDLGYNNTTDPAWAFTSGQHTTPFDGGWVGALKVGRDMGMWRAELEYSHRKNDAQYFGPPGDMDIARGDITSDTLMVNGYYDFMPTGQVTPYLGAGIGVSKVEANDVRKDITNCCSGIVDDSDTVMAAQLMAGAAYQVSSNLAMNVEYRFMVTKDPSFDYGTACDHDESIAACGVAGQTSGSYRNHSVMVGVRYSF